MSSPRRLKPIFHSVFNPTIRGVTGMNFRLGRRQGIADTEKAIRKVLLDDAKEYAKNIGVTIPKFRGTEVEKINGIRNFLNKIIESGDDLLTKELSEKEGLMKEIKRAKKILENNLETIRDKKRYINKLQEKKLLKKGNILLTEYDHLQKVLAVTEDEIQRMLPSVTKKDGSIKHGGNDSVKVFRSLEDLKDLLDSNIAKTNTKIKEYYNTLPISFFHLQPEATKLYDVEDIAKDFNYHRNNYNNTIKKYANEVQEEIFQLENDIDVETADFDNVLLATGNVVGVDLSADAVDLPDYKKEEADEPEPESYDLDDDIELLDDPIESEPETLGNQNDPKDSNVIKSILPKILDTN